MWLIFRPLWDISSEMQDVLLNKSHNFPPEKVATPQKNTFSLLLSHFFVEIMPQNLVNR